MRGGGAGQPQLTPELHRVLDAAQQAATKAGDAYVAQDRVLLTRDVGLLERSALVYGGFLHETDSRLQLREVLDRFRLHSRIAPLTRCARCNGLIAPSTPAMARGRVPGGVLREQRRFSRCGDCGQVYWPGGHLARLRARLAEIGVWF